MAAAAHWRVRGVVGHATRTDRTSPALRSLRASSRAGRVLPAPGAAEMRNGPRVQPASAPRARVCQGRRPGVDRKVVEVPGAGLANDIEPGILRGGPDDLLPARGPARPAWLRAPGGPPYLPGAV